MQDRFLFRIWDKESQKYHNGMEVFDYMRGVLSPDKYVMEQSTGLIDKKGKLIYEGDIVKDIEGYIGQVKFCVGTARFIIEFAEDISDFSIDMPHELKIIGNIHENPELLGEE